VASGTRMISKVKFHMRSGGKEHEMLSQCNEKDE